MAKKVAAIVSDGFEQVELDEPVAALRRAGCEVVVLAEDEAHLDGIKGMHHFDGYLCSASLRPTRESAAWVLSLRRSLNTLATARCTLPKQVSHGSSE